MAGTAPADETYIVKTIIPVTGGLQSFDIAFVDANIRTFVLADRTNKSIDVVDTSTNILAHQYPATPPFVGVVSSPANASGPNGVIIVDQREIWATDAPIPSTCSGTPTICTTPSSTKVIDLSTGVTTHVIPNGGIRRTDELCEDVKHEVVLSANDDPLDNFLTFMSAETYSIIGTNHKLDGSDPNFKITLTPTLAGTTNAPLMALSSASSICAPVRITWLSRRRKLQQPRGPQRVPVLSSKSQSTHRSTSSRPSRSRLRPAASDRKAWRSARVMRSSLAAVERIR